MASEYLIFNNPLLPERIKNIIKMLDFKENQQVLDIGCGRGILMKMIAELGSAHVTGVDINESEISCAQHNLSEFTNFELYCCPARKILSRNIRYDGVFCIGSSGAFGHGQTGILEGLKEMSEKVKIGGYLILGECYWKQEPADEYLQMTGMHKNDLFFYEKNIEQAEKFNLKLVYTLRASEQDWDHFESCFWFQAYREYAENPCDTALKKREHWENWKQAYIQWGKDTLGFALYLFQKM